jgi:dolichol-phosphate mannosyltransferase
MKPLIVMPTYNELANLERSIQKIELLKVDRSSDQIFANLSVLVVDDNSPDQTGALADSLASTRPWLCVLHRSKKEGLGGAYLAGFEWALSRDFTHVLEMDADGSHRVEDLPAMLTAAQSSDLSIGSRWIDGGAVQNWPWYRQAISRFGNSYAKFMLRSNINDMTAGFRVFSAKLLRNMDLSGIASHGYGFQVEMAWRAEKLGAQITEVPITFVERTVGRSKMTYGIVAEALWLVTLWGFRSYRSAWPPARRARM